MLLKDILQLKYGKNQTAVADSNGKYPIYGTGGIMGYASDFLYNKPSILFGRKGSISKVQFVDKPFWCVDTTFYSIIDESKVIPKYLFYKFENIDFSIFDEGTTIPSLRTETLNKLNFSIDSMDLQQHIVDTIGSIDDLIEKNEKIIEDLMKQSSLIIQKNNFKNQEKSCNLSDIASVTSGKSTPKLEEGKYEIIGANGILGYTNDFNIQDNVIITGRVGTIGTFSQYNKKIWCSDNTLIIKSKYFNYLFYYLKENFNAKSFNRGSTQPLITQSDMLKFEIKVPANIDELEENLNTYYQIIEIKKKENNLLKKEKDILLKKYFG